MPRNASGIYTLPGGNPVTPGDVIEASWANTTLEDVADALTNSLSRTGAGGMLAPFRIADGSISAPGLSYLNETNTGLYRSGSGSTWMAVLGVNVAQFSTVGLTIASAKALTALGNASVGGTFGVTGATTLASTLAVTGAITASGGVLGNVTAGSGTSTFNNVVINGNLDMDAGSSGTITNLPNPTNPGDAANKAYVDSQDALRLALTGGTMTGAIAMSNNKVTGVATPTADQDAANKAYVDSVAQGIDAKASCKAATTANITLSGNQTIDGVAVVAGDRVLVKNQSSAADNGIYVAASSTWSRSSDANTWDELVAAFTFVEQGTENGNNGYICTIAPGGTLGVTAVTWAQFSGAGQIIAGQGLSKTGNTIQVNTASSSRIVIGADDIDLATTGVVADTYKSVSVDAYGRVTAGTNPTTLAGFGIGDAYTKTETNSLLAAKLSLAGGTMSGAIAMGGSKITGMADPTLAQDAATKNYIDTIFGSTTSAAASAAAAATSASNAASSASSASTSATNAASSATSAAASATSAAASFDSFDDRYLGAKASDPTVDNDGNPLLTGALYWNTTSSQMRVYDGSAWVAAYLPAGAYMDLTTNQTAAGVKTFTSGTIIQGLTVGRGAGAVSTNTAVGASALAANTASGIRNTAIGYESMLINTDGNRNVAVGYASMRQNTTGTNNVAIGVEASYTNTTGSYNSVLGWSAFSTNTTGSQNTAFGASALASNTTANNNVAVGHQAAYNNTTGAQLTAVGQAALYANTTGNSNVAIGRYALSSNTTGSSNVAVGLESLNLNTTASLNTAVGHQAGYSNVTGTRVTFVGNSAGFFSTADQNTAVGYAALYGTTTGAYNSAVGDTSLYANTTGSSNTALGFASLRLNTTGTNNVAIGVQAGYSNTTGSRNTYVGMYAGYSANKTDGDAGNTYVGYQAGNNTTTGAANTFMGGNGTSQLGAAGFSVTTGSFNTLLGVSAGYYITTGSKNTILGAYSGNQGGLDIRTANNYIVLSDGDGNPRAYWDTNGVFYQPNDQLIRSGKGLAFYDAANSGYYSLYNSSGTLTFSNGASRVTLDGNGNLALTDQGGNSRFYAAGVYNVTGGASANMVVSADGGFYRSASSLKYKKNVQDAVHGLSSLLQLRPVTYESKNENEAGIVYGGLIAEEVHAAGLTEFVQYANDGTPDALAYSNMVSLCVKAIQEQQAIIESLKARLDAANL